MTQLEKLKLYVPEEENDNLLEMILEDAEELILSRRYPFREEGKEYVLEDKFLSLQVKIAVEMYNKMGAEGETQHTENGVMRVWEKANVSNNLLEQIIPMASVPA